VIRRLECHSGAGNVRRIPHDETKVSIVAPSVSGVNGPGISVELLA
jgi:hypothetical protein